MMVTGLTTIIPAVNAGNIEVQGIDVSLGCRWSTDYGNFRLAADYTHIDEYLVKTFLASSLDYKRLVDSMPRVRMANRTSYVRSQTTVRIYPSAGIWITTA